MLKVFFVENVKGLSVGYLIRAADRMEAAKLASPGDGVVCCIEIPVDEFNDFIADRLRRIQIK